MAIPGFDATGRLAVGQVRQVTSLVAVAGSYTLAGASATFSSSETASAGAYVLTGNAANDTVLVPEPTGAHVFNGIAATFKVAAAETSGGYALAEVRYFIGSGIDALGRLAVGQITRPVAPPFGATFPMVMRSAGAVITLASPNAPLSRSGGDFDQVYGGIGYYLEEIERLKQFAKITRKTPAPIVQPPAPLPALPSAPGAAPPPAIDLGAIATQRIAAQQAQAEQARTLKRRRQEAEILLLAS